MNPSNLKFLLAHLNRQHRLHRRASLHAASTAVALGSIIVFLILLCLFLSPYCHHARDLIHAFFGN